MTNRETKNRMSGTDITRFAEVSGREKADLARNGLGLQGIATERAADELEEARLRSSPSHGDGPRPNRRPYSWYLRSL